MRTLLVAGLASLFGLAIGCSAPATDDSGASSTAAVSSHDCQMSREEILASVSGSRRTAIERGFRWLDARVPYSQSRVREGYRTDCSGFISMCWGLDRSYTTPYFANGTAHDDMLRSYEDLQPADALVYRSGTHGHIVLFLGWDDDAHTSACVLEQASTKSDMQFRARSTSSLHSAGYHPVRADRLPVSVEENPQMVADPTDDGEGDAADDSDDDGADAPASCTTDGQCNPGDNGSGKICSPQGQCVPGCHTDAQCPGETTCSAAGRCE